MKNLKRKLLIGASTLLFMGAVLVPNKADAHRVLDYEWNCVGSGGNCLNDVVIKPEM